MIREADMTDAPDLSRLMDDVEASSDYMLWEPGERTADTEHQKSMIQRMKARHNSTILVADNQNHALTGYLLAIGGDAKRNKHVAYIVIGISEKNRGEGIGSALLKRLEQWAKQHKVHRLELTVVTRNEAALSLYQRMGFAIEGVKKHALFINQEYVDEYNMAKLL